MKLLGATAIVACVALAACAPQPTPFGGGGVVGFGGFGGATAVTPAAPAATAFPADQFRGTARVCAEGIVVVFANDLTPTSMSVSLVLGLGTLSFTASGGPYVFLGRASGAGITLEFAADYSTFDVTYAPDGGAQIFGNGCR